MNPIDVGELFKRKEFNDKTDYEIKVTSALVDQDATLKVNVHTEYSGVMFEQTYTTKESRHKGV